MQHRWAWEPWGPFPSKHSSLMPILPRRWSAGLSCWWFHLRTAGVGSLANSLFREGAVWKRKSHSTVLTIPTGVGFCHILSINSINCHCMSSGCFTRTGHREVALDAQHLTHDWCSTGAPVCWPGSSGASWEDRSTNWASTSRSKLVEEKNWKVIVSIRYLKVFDWELRIATFDWSLWDAVGWKEDLVWWYQIVLSTSFASRAPKMWIDRIQTGNTFV